MDRRRRDRRRRNIVHNPRNFRPHVKIFERYTDSELLGYYRFNREGLEFLLDLLNPVLEVTSARGRPLPADVKLCIALRFYGCGTFQKVVGDSLNGSQSTVSRVVECVTNGLVALAPNHIKFPTTNENVARATAGFRLMTGCRIPKVMGCVDGTHVRILAPSSNEHEEAYVNRKGFHSINVQIVSDAYSNIMQIEARWPGSVHDSTILKESPVWGQMPRIQDHGVLLGDSGYPCKRFLLTPFRNPSSNKEERFNRFVLYCLKIHPMPGYKII